MCSVKKKERRHKYLAFSGVEPFYPSSLYMMTKVCHGITHHAFLYYMCCCLLKHCCTLAYHFFFFNNRHLYIHVYTLILWIGLNSRFHHKNPTTLVCAHHVFRCVNGTSFLKKKYKHGDHVFRFLPNKIVSQQI